MKSYFYLVKKYIKSYKKRCICIVLCMSLFLFAFLTILWYHSSFNYSLDINDKLKNGSYKTIEFYANKDLVSKNENELIKEGAGILKGLWKIDNEEADIWVGSADERVIDLLSIKFLKGEMPKSKNEAAIEQSTYDALDLKCKLGDTVDLAVRNEDGSTVMKSFVLTGIIENFSSRLKSLSKSDDGTQIFSIPSVLTINQDVDPGYVHVVSKEISGTTLGLDSKSSYFAEDNDIYSSTSDVSNLILTIMISIFVLTTVIGVLTISVYFFKEQEQYLNLLRCIGFSKKKSRKLLFIQGLLLLISSLVIAVVASVLVLLLLQLISSFSSQPLFLDLNPLILIAAILLEGIISFVSFNVLLGRFYKNVPLRLTIHSSKRPRKSQTNIKRCWHKAYSGKYRIQNTSCIVLIFLCVVMSIFGSFHPLFMARTTTFDNPDNFPNNSDYCLHMYGGSSNVKSYYINFPIGEGVSRKLADKIASDDRVRVLDASVSQTCIPFFLTAQDPENKLLYKYAVEAEKAGHNYLLKNDHEDEMIRLAGGNSSTENLVELPIMWQSYASVRNKIDTFSNGEISEKGYKDGVQVIAPDDLCSVGDEFTMVVPIPDEYATEKNIDEHIKFEVAKVQVAATYSKEQYDSDELILSTEYIFSIYPDLNYEIFLIENLDHNDQDWVDELEQDLENLELHSRNIRYDNYAEMSKEFYDKVNLQTFQTVVSVFIFIIIIMVAIVFSSFVQVRSNLRSYIIMRAVGARIETIRKLVTNEIHYIMTVGIVSGAVVGWVLIMYLSSRGYEKVWDIYLFYVAPVFIGTVILLYFGSRLATKRAVHSLINRNIIERLNEIE